MDLRETQAPLKERYKASPTAALITLRASASEHDTPISCSVDIGRAVYEAEAHSGVGGTGTAACSGDLLLGALAACAQITCQMIASASGVPVKSVRVQVEGDLDLRGTLAMSREAACGFSAIRLHFDIDAPEATEKQLENLHRRSEQLCVVLQTLMHPPAIESSWGRV
jgi:uncharacterized OsmC-like protein